MESSVRLICRAPLIWLLVPLIWGYLLGYYYRGGSALLLALIGTSLAIAALPFLFLDKWRVGWALLFLTGGTFLAWSYFLNRLHTPSSEWKELPLREAELSFQVRRIFQPTNHFNLLSGIARVCEVPPHLRDLEGQKIYFQLKPRQEGKAPVRTEVLRARGVLFYADKSSAASAFDDSLIHAGVYFNLSGGRILENVQPATPFHRFCVQQNNFFETILKRGAASGSKLSDTYVAMLLGKKSALSRQQKEVYMKSGTMHFFAISGLHVAAVALTLHYFFMLLRLPSRLATVLGLGLLFLYVQITGATPSAVRAFLMVAFYWSSMVVLRQASPFAALLLSAFIVLLLEPLQLWSVGFQLSYTVVGSILLYGLPLIACLNRRLVPFRYLPESSHQWHHQALRFTTQRGIELFAISVAATLISSPLVIYYFHIFTPGAIILNIVLVSLASLLIICGFISLLFGLMHAGWISAFFNHAAWVILWTMEKMIDLFLQLPGFFWQLTYSWPKWGPVTLVVLLIAMMVTHSKKPAQNYLAFCIPPLILMVVIIFTTRSIT